MTEFLGVISFWGFVIVAALGMMVVVHCVQKLRERRKNQA
jgi:hypothetical protein